MNRRITLHGHSLHPAVVVGGRYSIPMAPGHSIEMMPESLNRFEFPGGEARRAASRGGQPVGA